MTDKIKHAMMEVHLESGKMAGVDLYLTAEQLQGNPQELIKSTILPALAILRHSLFPTPADVEADAKREAKMAAIKAAQAAGITFEEYQAGKRAEVA